MNIVIREIHVKDSEAITSLSAQLGYSISLTYTKANIEQVLTLHDHVAYVAIDGEQTIAWAHAYKTITIESLPFIELAGLVVDENYRSKGIGNMMVAKIKEWCMEQKIYSLRVRSNVKRKEAHRFYLNNGFKEIKEQKVFQIELK